MPKKSLIVAVAAVVAAAMWAPAPAFAASPALTYVPDANWWGTNGRVADIVTVGNTVYLAGGFDYVGPDTGHGAVVDGTVGTNQLGTQALIDGDVYTAVPDGSGGWYLGGDFQHVDGQFRRNAARINADGSLAAWNPKPDDVVDAITVAGNEVVLGGAFANIGTTPVAASHIGAVDLTKGQAVSGFTASANNTVRALASSGSTVYAGGDFGTVDGSARLGLVRLTAATGAVDSTFPGQSNGPVRALTLSSDGSTLYAGGDFTQAFDGSAWQGRGRLAAYSTAGNTLLPWAPSADNSVYALAADPSSSTVYAGGLFGSVNGVARTRLAAIDGTGATTAWNPALSGCNTPHVIDNAHSNPPCTPEVDALAVSNGNLYVGGRFEESGTTVRHDAAAFALAGGTLAGWNPVASDRPLAVGASNGSIFLGGDLTSVNGLVRHGVAALNMTTGAGVPTFTADTDDEVLDLAASPDGSTLYLAGHFVTVNGVARKKIAAVSTATGTVVKGFKANANNDALNLAFAGGSLYATGQFTKVNSSARSHAVKLNAATGAVDPTFIANTTGPTGKLRDGGMVQSMVASADGSKVFLGGPFTSLNGTSVPNGVSVVNGTTGSLISNLGGVENCGAGLGPWIVKLYLSADGQRLYGGDVCPDRIYQWNATTLTTVANPTGLNWKGWCNGGMQGALEVDGNFYFGSHGGDKGAGGVCWASPANHTNVVQSRYAVFDATTGALFPDSPQFDSPMGVWSFAQIPQGLLVGGDFTFAGNSQQVHQGLVLFPGTL